VEGSKKEQGKEPETQTMGKPLVEVTTRQKGGTGGERERPNCGFKRTVEKKGEAKFKKKERKSRGETQESGRVGEMERHSEKKDQLSKKEKNEDEKKGWVGRAERGKNGARLEVKKNEGHECGYMSESPIP